METEYSKKNVRVTIKIIVKLFIYVDYMIVAPDNRGISEQTEKTK